ncbi:hypothetical protein [Delftia phage PhiW-14]|uniref:Uncharacterized protein n=1 Tax=Delftia phage PhiW-14 TaxID=665032 RepID=C9DG64_BPW14|nr:hypothetical protein DP-phiW-14_gp094 [Delftia phage PhiW-14]ACV50115.1 hypothetical protein [Delftia phage PhiW-14]
MNEFGNYLQAKAESRGEYIAALNALKVGINAALPIYREFHEGKIDEDGLKDKLKAAGLWKSDIFKPHACGYCRLIRGIINNQKGVSYQAVCPKVTTIHSGDEHFPVKVYGDDGSPSDAYREASVEGTLWKDAYGRSRLRSLQMFLEHINEDILNPERRAPEPEVEPDTPKEDPGPAAEADDGDDA